MQPPSRSESAAANTPRRPYLAGHPYFSYSYGASALAPMTVRVTFAPIIQVGAA